MQSMYYAGLDVHKKTISYCVKDFSGNVHAEGSIHATRSDLDRWMKTLPQRVGRAFALLTKTYHGSPWNQESVFSCLTGGGMAPATIRLKDDLGG